jgi:hypothetical protein
MQDIKGTNGPDKVIVQAGDRFRGKGGDDHITLLEWATGEGGPGNDTLIGDPNGRHGQATAWYWSSPEPILVDLGEGYALDGFGGRDTLINIYNVHGFKRDGDKGYGSDLDDRFWVGPWKGQNGLIFIDGRGGNDTVTIGYRASENRGDVVFNTSADGKLVRAHLSKQPGLVMEFRNVETIQVSLDMENGHWVNTDYRVSDLIDLSQAGKEILVRSATGLQTGGLGKPVTITYSFLDKPPPTGGEGGTGFEAFSASLQQTTRTILSTLQQQTGITFQEVQGDTGTIRFGINQQSNTRGYSFLPDQHRNDAKAGDVWLDVETVALMQPGQEGYYVLLHELAHSLGLQHPLRENDISGQTVLLDGFATFAHTLMLDISATQNMGNAWPSWYGLFDLQALRHLYGSKAFAVANNTYKIIDGPSSASVVILDDGGIDVLDISGSRVSGNVDLRPGKVSSVGMNAEGMAHFGNLSIAPGTWIENLVATPFDDYIVANDLGNVIWSMGGNDIILGHGGHDTVILPGRSTDWRIQRAADGQTWNAEAKDGEAGSVELLSIERLHFADAGVALDMQPNGNPARVAKILGAVFGPESVKNLQFAAIGLSYLEGLNYSYEQLMKLAIDVRLGSQANDPASVVNLLYGNVVGQMPSPTQAKPYVDMLTQGKTSTAGLGVLAAETGLNQDKIGLVGLFDNGFHFAL